MGQIGKEKEKKKKEFKTTATPQLKLAQRRELFGEVVCKPK